MKDTKDKYNRWINLLPWIDIYYAVKSNPIVPLLKVLADLGSNFDCASKNEIDLVLRLGVHPDRIIFSNPIKAENELIWA